MKKIEDYKGQKIAIHFPTYELWLRRKEINPSDNCMDSFFTKKQSFYYYPFEDSNGGTYSNEKIAIEQGYTILPATDFLEEEFIYGQEYEFSDYKNFANSRINFFGCKIPYKNAFKIVSFNKDGEIIYFKYCRKINTERKEAITTIKELVSKFSINQNEVF